jgi:LPXTG-motif cell wall-anchored protein
VLTVVVSFYGMNIALPGGHNPGGYELTWVLLLIIMLVIVGGMLLYFRRKRWL